MTILLLVCDNIERGTVRPRVGSYIVAITVIPISGLPKCIPRSFQGYIDGKTNNHIYKNESNNIDVNMDINDRNRRNRSIKEVL